MTLENDWTPEIKDWDKVPLETYKFLFDRAEKRFEETLSESESITSKSIKLLTGIVLAIPFFIALTFTKISLCFSLFFVLLYILDVVVLIILVFPKNIARRGSEPKDIYCEYIENKGYNEEDKKAIVYYHELKRIQQGIELNNNANGERIELYKIVLILSLIIFSIGVMVGIIFHPL